MSSIANLQQFAPPEKVNRTTFLALVWASAAITFPFVAFRIFVRRKVFHKLFVDDFLVQFAYLLLLAFAINWQISAYDMYVFVDLTSGFAPPDKSFAAHFQRHHIAEIVSFLLCGLCLWSVKLAFLLFFRRLGHRVRKQRIVWWIVLIVNLLAFVVFIGIMSWTCMTLPLEEAAGRCNNKATVDYAQVSIKLQAAADILSDASIMVTPTILLWNLQLTLRKKLLLGGIFSLTVIIMIASVVRIIVVTSGGGQLDQSWLHTWTVIEMGVAVIVACVASFRALFTTDTASQRVPAIHEDHRNDPERHALAKFNFQNIGRSSMSIVRTAAPRDDTPFDPSLTSSKAFITASNEQQYEHAFEEDGYKMLSKTSGEISGLKSDQIRVTSHVNVHAEDGLMMPEAVHYR